MSLFFKPPMIMSWPADRSSTGRRFTAPGCQWGCVHWKACWSKWLLDSFQHVKGILPPDAENEKVADAMGLIAPEEIIGRLHNSHINFRNQGCRGQKGAMRMTLHSSVLIFVLNICQFFLWTDGKWICCPCPRVLTLWKSARLKSPCLG